MLLQARLTREDLRAAIVQFAPVIVRLGEDGELSLDEVSDVALVAGKGVRIVCSGRLRWSVLGIRIPVTLESLSVAIAPSIEGKAGGEALVFKLEIEHTELSMVPRIIGDHVTDRVNKELEAKHVELSWAFPRTLSHEFSMPASLENLVSFGLRAVAGTVEVTSEALVFGVAFTSEVIRRPAPEV